MVSRGRINTDIGEIEIERDENPLLSLRGAKHSWIGVASQLLGQHGMDIVTGLLKQDRSIARKILIEFDLNRVGILRAYAGIGTIRSLTKSAA